MLLFGQALEFFACTVCTVKVRLDVDLSVTRYFRYVEDIVFCAICLFLLFDLLFSSLLGMMIADGRDVEIIFIVILVLNLRILVASLLWTRCHIQADYTHVSRSMHKVFILISITILMLSLLNLTDIGGNFGVLLALFI